MKDIKNNPLNENTIDSKMELDDLNKELIKKNDGNIELQTAINIYIKNYLNFTIESNKLMSYDECFQLTISEDMDYNVLHPFFFDDDFYIQLLGYFIEKENYKKCSLIKRRRDNISK